MSTLDEILPPPAWHQHAACRGMGTDLFFPTSGESCTAAVAVCNRCPVRLDCREAGLTELHGIWGGLPEKRRRVVRRTRQLEVS